MGHFERAGQPAYALYSYTGMSHRVFGINTRIRVSDKRRKRCPTKHAFIQKQIINVVISSDQIRQIIIEITSQTPP